MKEIAFIFIAIVIILTIYGIVGISMFIYKSNKEWKSFQGCSKPSPQFTQSQLHHSQATSNETSYVENSQRLSNGFYRMSVFHIP